MKAVESPLMIIDMWYGDQITDVDELDVFFYPNAGQYRGNLYRSGKMIGDYTTESSIELENTFPQIDFIWD